VSPRVLVIDNYDSFTYNLVQAFLVLGAEVMVRHNDALDVGAALDLAATHLVISPGPGRAEHAGVSMSMLEAFLGKVPVLGVCLGHQALAQVLGGIVVPAKRLVHGKTSEVHHDGRTIFASLRNPFTAGRYHSLAVAEEGLPAELEVSARTSEGEIMGLRHRAFPAEGVQFHPESILTPDGGLLLRNFLGLAAR
jgi:anthranilate synthase/aminodeoxychorismate synthase-like glutamine amidotransferase